MTFMMFVCVLCMSDCPTGKSGSLKPPSYSIICAEAHFLDSSMVLIHFKLLKWLLNLANFV